MDRSHGEFSAQENVGYVVSELSNDMSDVAYGKTQHFLAAVIQRCPLSGAAEQTQRAAYPRYYHLSLRDVRQGTSILNFLTLSCSQPHDFYFTQQIMHVIVG
jgi:hypothetical protein